MRTTPLVEQVYELSDIFLLTSRLDPLPGVAIEAMSHRLPILCFDETTGIANVLATDDCGRDCVVPYLDTAAMAAKVLELVGTPGRCGDVGDRLHELAQRYFCMDSYIERLESLAMAVRRSNPDVASGESAGF